MDALPKKFIEENEAKLTIIVAVVPRALAESKRVVDDPSQGPPNDYRQHYAERGVKAGVDDVRAGKPARFDEFDSDDYERGRQWAMIAPLTMPLRINGGKLNPDAIRLLDNAFDRGDLT